MPTKTEGQIAYEAEIAKQRSGHVGAHAETWPAWEKLTDEQRGKWEDPTFRARALSSSGILRSGGPR